jgi:site-specific DNA-methyltransferase (adenine-specific)
MVELIHGDCLAEMLLIPEKSIDLVLVDPPYGTTACKWDTVIPFDKMWAALLPVVKDNAAICIFGSEPFSSALRMNNLKKFRYDWIWKKDRPANISAMRMQPGKYHEIISVFYGGHFYAQKIARSESGARRSAQAKKSGKQGFAGFYELNSKIRGKAYRIDPHRYETEMKNPSSILEYPRVQNGKHPTQKPVALLEYLIKTYTLEGETVLDFTMGSGSTGVAAKNLGRKFIGIEKEEKYFEIAKQRIYG